MKVLIIGRGRVGNGLRRALRASDAVEVTASGRKVPSASLRGADVLVLAVSDDAIESVAAAIAPSVRLEATVLHCAGARSVEVLAPCEARGAAVGILHPLVSFPVKRDNPSLVGATFVVSGSKRAIVASRRIAKACGARVLVAHTGDPAYHAAAALVANGAAALAFVSVGILERLGFDKRAAERAIGGLLETVGQNVQSLGVPDSLTGPIARGEATAVSSHRRALRRVSRPALQAYDALVPVIVRCARAAGLPKSKADEIRKTLGH
jgi:predicted short-subunit dehydrogenase-like oxidoreductase (DUF2520 family)